MLFFFADIPVNRGNDVGQLCATIAVSCVAFIIVAAIFALPLLRGRKLKRKCACAASKEVVKLYEEREKAAFRAKLYDPKTVDTSNLPQADPAVAQYARAEDGKSDA